MGIDHSNPYIHSTTVLCDSEGAAVAVLCDGDTTNCACSLVQSEFEGTLIMFLLEVLKY